MSIATPSGNLIPAQFYAKKIGISGCYFLCICEISRQLTGNDVDSIEKLYECSKKKTSDIVWITADCYVNFPEKILEYLSGQKFEVIKTTDLDYPVKDGDFLVGMYEYGEYTHFVVLDKDRNVVYDPYGNSSTVKNGELKSLRVFRKV